MKVFSNLYASSKTTTRDLGRQDESEIVKTERFSPPSRQLVRLVFLNS